MLLYDAVKLNAPVIFTPYFNDGYSRPIDSGQDYTMSPDHVMPFITELDMLSRLNIIEDTRQNLAQRADGTQLQTAFPSLVDFKEAISDMNSVPKELLKLVHEWQELGANEVNIDFEQVPR